MNPRPAISKTAAAMSATSRAVLLPDDSAGTHSNVPTAATGAPATDIGTRQSKILVRTPSSFTWGGVPFSIEWMRWSNHRYEPSFDTGFHLGFADLAFLVFDRDLGIQLVFLDRAFLFDRRIAP